LLAIVVALFPKFRLYLRKEPPAIEKSLRHQKAQPAGSASEVLLGYFRLLISKYSTLEFQNSSQEIAQSVIRFHFNLSDVKPTLFVLDPPQLTLPD
jgi:hypothetical protein